MTFRKYASIDNHYQTKEIMRWLDAYPELKDESFVLEEKIDGANIQVYFSPDGEVRAGKRSQFISREENFYGLWNLLDNDYSELIDEFQSKAMEDKISYRLWGEIYGPGIQKRIKYNVETPKLIFFDMEKNNNLISSFSFHAGNQTRFVPTVPIVDVVEGLENALSYSREFQSKLSADNAEGYVIKPFYKQYYRNIRPVYVGDHQTTAERFIFKGKSEAFAEKMKVVTKERKQLPEKVMEAYSTFNSYLTDNRLENVIGNHGPFVETKQIGDYIRYMLDDMKKDFVADGFDEALFEPEELKQIYNVGHKIVPLLKARL